jgi:flagellar biosynthetic protein FlhB
VALKIIEVAQANNIPMKEDKPLARALYASVEVNMEIPPEFYAVLAEVMAWVYTLKKEEK